MGVFDFLKKKEVEVVKEWDYKTEIKPYSSDIPYGSNFVYSPPVYNINPRELRLYALTSDIYRTILNALRQEALRKGVEIDKLYEAKCSKCGATYDYTPEDCPNCGNSCYKPAITTREEMEKRIDKANPVQTMVDMLGCIEDDLNIYDMAYLVLEKNYVFRQNEIFTAKVSNVWRGDPALMRKLMNTSGMLGYMGNRKVYVCPNHRQTLQHTNGFCPTCGVRVYPAHYAQITAVGEQKENLIYFIEGEVIFRTKFQPTVGYPLSPVITLFTKINTLMKQDEYLMKAYSDQKAPKGLLFVQGGKYESFKKAWKEMLELSASNPHLIYPMISEGEKSNPAQYIDFLRNMQEMEYVASREEYRKAIGAFFGVSPLFMGDVSASGGLNNERLQIIVTNRAIEKSQAVHNSILKEMSKVMGYEGWAYVLPPSEDRDEMNELLVEQQKIANAQSMRLLGYKVNMDDEGNFEYEQDDAPPPEMPDFAAPFSLPENPNKPQGADGEPDKGSS